MPLDGMREEMIRQLEEQSATPAQIADYQTRWNHAMTHPGKPLPCPLCFLGGEMRRLRSISDEGGVGVARCEHCHETFEYAAPEAT